MLNHDSAKEATARSEYQQATDELYATLPRLSNFDPQSEDTLTSAFDKAAKTGVIHKGKADRKKSRLSARLATIK